MEQAKERFASHQVNRHTRGKALDDNYAKATNLENVDQLNDATRKLEQMIA